MNKLINPSEKVCCFESSDFFELNRPKSRILADVEVCGFQEPVIHSTIAKVLPKFTQFINLARLCLSCSNLPTQNVVFSPSPRDVKINIEDK